MKAPFSVLIVEDDPSETKLLEMLITRHFPDWQYGFASSAEQAMALKRWRYSNNR